MVNLSVQLTSVHYRYDVRIFHKISKSLIKNGFDVILIVADGLGPEIKDSVKIIDQGKSKNRLNRFIFTNYKIFSNCLKYKKAIFHIHDPELFIYGLILKLFGYTVIIDIHEDVPSQILSKPYLNKYFLHNISKIYKIYEKLVYKYFNYLLCATPHIYSKYKYINAFSETICNYPILSYENNDNYLSKTNYICYIGGIDSIRGIRELVKAMSLVSSDTTLLLAGKIENRDNLFLELKNMCVLVQSKIFRIC